MKKNNPIIDDIEFKIRQQQKICHETIFGRMGSSPIDYECGCNCPDFKENECQNCGEITEDGAYTTTVKF